MTSFHMQGSSDVNIQHTVALRGLPFYLHEDDGTFIKTWDVSKLSIIDMTVKGVVFGHRTSFPS